MKKIVIAAVALVAIGFVVRRIGSKVANVSWERRFAAMPENAPRKWMFRNISEIRDNTDRILELLDDGVGKADREPGTVTLGR